MSTSSSETVPSPAAVDPHRWCYVKSPHLPSKQRRNRPISKEEEEQNFFTDGSKESTPRRTPTPDPAGLTEEDANTMLEEEDFRALPRLADELADERRRLYDLRQQNALLAPGSPAKPDPNDDKSSSRSFVAIVPRSRSNQGNRTEPTTSRKSKMLNLLTSHRTNQTTTLRTQSRAFFKSVSATNVKDSLHSLLHPQMSEDPKSASVRSSWFKNTSLSPDNCVTLRAETIDCYIHAATMNSSRSEFQSNLEHNVKIEPRAGAPFAAHNEALSKIPANLAQLGIHRSRKLLPVLFLVNTNISQPLATQRISAPGQWS
ncbi:MAG: hypothetical protein Q9176_000418 [Flavoplaca citrina]